MLDKVCPKETVADRLRWLVFITACLFSLPHGICPVLVVGWCLAEHGQQAPLDLGIRALPKRAHDRVQVKEQLKLSGLLFNRRITKVVDLHAYDMIPAPNLVVML